MTSISINILVVNKGYLNKINQRIHFFKSKSKTLSFQKNFVPLKVGVWLLAGLKPVKRQMGGKESLLYFGGQQPGGKGGLLSKGQLPPTDNQFHSVNIFK